MELKKDGILFINLLFRIIALVGFVSNYESPNLPIKDAILNWNKEITDRMILILANGLRDDFLQLGETPFLGEIAEESGAFAIARVDEFVTVEGNLRALITGLPWHGSLLPWNRPKKYKTILDYASCKCVIGELPLRKRLKCQQFGQNQSEVFEIFRKMKDTNDMDCMYVLSFDFGGFSGRDYVESLRRLDEDIREATENWEDSTWLLTSSRGWSVWNRKDGRVDVPVLIWGKGIVPTREIRTLSLPDISALVSTLIGRSFPAGSLGEIPTYLLATDIESKFHMILYNFEHLERTLGYSAEFDEYEGRNLDGIIDEENILSLKISIENFLEMIQNLRTHRMKILALTILVCFALWSVAFLEAIVRGFLTIDMSSSVMFVSTTAVVALTIFLYPGIIYVALLFLLTPISFISFSHFIEYFHAEGYRLFLVSIVTLVSCPLFSLIGNRATIILLMIPIGLWPILFRTTNRVNKKVLLLWFVSTSFLVGLQFFDVIGRDPTPEVSILSGLLHIGFFHSIYLMFKRRIDRQSWIITILVLSSSYHVYLSYLWGFTIVSCLIYWCLLLFAVFLTFALRGTLLETHLKLQFLLLVPMQLLSIRHEPVFHVALSCLAFSWIFIENVAIEKNILCYNPSIFSLECPTELSTDGLQVKHYRQIFFFLIFSYLSFFAVGNLPTVYTYDLAILKPFFGYQPFFLIPLKLVIPFVSILQAFLTLQFVQKTPPAPLLIISIHLSDVIASFFLINAYILKNFFTVDVSHYIVLQIATAAITTLYFFHKYAYFHFRKT